MANPTAPGWYDDPDNPEQLRYFDGVVWSQHTTPRVTRQAQPPQQSAAPGETWRHDAGQAPGQWGQPQDRWQAPPSGQWQQPGAPGQWQAPPMAGWSNEPGTRDGQPYARWIERVGAYLVDSLILTVPTALVAGYPILKGMGPFIEAYRALLADPTDEARMEALRAAPLDYPWLALGMALSLLVQLAYQTFFLTRSGATPGKRMLGISVRDEDARGPLSLAQALRRQALQIGLSIVGAVPVVGTLTGIVSFLDYLFPLWDAKRQSLHDKVGRTVVVKGSQPPRSESGPPAS
ncbi:MAG: RDD family protein [Micrococcales bacterium]|nr:RDD family protein [Micrococcales bacterium]